MPCYSQWYEVSDGARERPLSCGRCIGCRLERSRQWAVRCMHEAQLHEENCFLTLTLKEAFFGQSLDHRQWQLFAKRLRRRIEPRKFKFFMCGEYGDEHMRPHYHALLFGYNFPDRYYFKKSESGEKLYRSPLLESVWTLGHSTIGSVTFESAAYVARYCTLEQRLPGVSAGYEVLDLETGELHVRIPEYGRMSLQGGIGKNWYKRFKHDVYPEGKVVINGGKARAPKYYDKLYKAEGLGDYMALAVRRRAEAGEVSESFPGRLEAREKVARARLAFSKRNKT